MWRRQLAGLVLINALDASAAFWDHVTECRASAAEAATAWQLARRYGQGQRRLAIAKLMLRAAAAPPHAARAALLGTVAASCFVSDMRGGRASTYRLGASFVAPLNEGAGLIARRGAGTCLADGREAPCPSVAAEGSTYCRRHDSDPVRAKVRRERQMRRTFDAAVPPILRGLPLSDWLEESLELAAGRA